MKISEIIYRGEYIVCEVEENLELSGIKTCISELESGDVLFIPNSEKMPDFSKTDHAPMAVVCGADAVLPSNIPAIRVVNPRFAMSNAYYRYHKPDLSNMQIIGVTGTNGKTSTATIIHSVLQNLGYKSGFIGTGKIEIGGENITGSDYSMTTPDPPLLYKSLKQMSDAGCKAVVMEVSSHSLALDKVAPLQFDYGIFTNLSPEHTDFHGDIDNYFSAKLKLFNNCKCGVFNIDDRYGKKAYNLCKSKKIAAGIIWRGDVWGTNIENMGFEGLSYIYHHKDFSFKMRLSLPGVYNAYNSMLAAAVCIDMGLRPCDVKDMIGCISSIPGRYEIINNKITVIIDYAHTPIAFESILKELYNQKREKQLTVVFGCGGNRDKSKRPKMAKIAEKYADKVILTSDNSRNEDPKDIIADVVRGFERGRYEVIEDRTEAITEAIISSNDSDIVAIIGKGTEKYNIDKNGYHAFDERKIVNYALQLREEKRICE